MTRTLKIIPVLNGWIVEAGCQKVVFTDLDNLCSSLKLYYTSPDMVEKQFLAKAVNKVLENPLCDVGTLDPRENRITENRIDPRWNPSTCPDAPKPAPPPTTAPNPLYSGPPF